MGRNYQRGVEPWEISPEGEKQPRQTGRAAPKTDRQRRRARERRNQWLLFAMIALTLGLGLAHMLLEEIPFTLRSGFQAVLKLEDLRLDGPLYRIFQVCSAMSCVITWFLVRASAPYAVGLLLLPGLLLLGWLLQSLKAEFGYKLMMTVLVLAELLMGLYLLFSIAFVLFVSNIPNALLQAAYYAVLFLYPLLELIVLRKWKENIY